MPVFWKPTFVAALVKAAVMLAAITTLRNLGVPACLSKIIEPLKK